MKSFKKPQIIIRTIGTPRPIILALSAFKITLRIIDIVLLVLNELRFCVVLPIKLQEGPFLLLVRIIVFQGVSSILHHDLVLSWLGTIVILSIRKILLRFSSIKMPSHPDIVALGRSIFLVLFHSFSMEFMALSRNRAAIFGLIL